MAVGLVALLVPFAAGAGAATICVGLEAQGCESTAPTVQAALDAASNSPAGDRIVIGAGRFEGPFRYLPGSAGGRIEVVGQGPATLLTAPPPVASAGTVLELVADTVGDGSVVSNLTVRIPSSTATKADTGIYADVVSGVRIASDANEPVSSGELVGVALPTPGGSLRNSVIELVGGNGVGVATGGASNTNPVTVADTRITAPVAVRASAQDTSVVRDRILAGQSGVVACNGPATVEDSLIRVSGTGIGLLATGENFCGTGQGSLVAREVTVIGAGTAAGEVGAE
ncbi:MAG: hypothetical protein ACHQCF_04380, partial [Solirubrobacterales bacterium]